jgi:hypothetical protein
MEDYIDGRLTYSLDKLVEVSGDNTLDDTSIDGGDIYGKEGSDDKSDGQEGEVEDFWRFPGRNNNLQ